MHFIMVMPFPLKKEYSSYSLFGKCVAARNTFQMVSVLSNKNYMMQNVGKGLLCQYANSENIDQHAQSWSLI